MLPLSEVNVWGSRRKYLIVMLCQLISTPLFVAMPSIAVLHGAIGHILEYTLGFIFLGIPLLYMECIISQFTARNCIDVWRARSCFSHIGYILVTWQTILISINHINLTFILHYLLISFENPIPYYTCGDWANEDCNILIDNYTVNKYCTKIKEPDFCKRLHTSFPEYQYFKFSVLGVNTTGYYIAWRITVASALLCIFTFLGCFQRKHSILRVVTLFTFYPIAGYAVLLVGSMLQKGVVVKYKAALDTTLSIFLIKRRTSLVILQIINSLGIGSGFNFNFGSTAPFRAPCYSNVVIVVMVCLATTILTVCTTAMMSCPYAYEYDIGPYEIMKSNIAMIYEKIPRMLYEYEYNFFWIVVTLSSHVVLGIGTNILYIHQLLEMAGEKYSQIVKHPGLSTAVAMVLLYLVSIPFLGYIGMCTIVGLKRFFCFITTLIAMLEIWVFILWYGVNKFSEDVHFMQGLQPKNYMKILWIISCVTLCYALSLEIYIKIKDYNGSLTDKIGWSTFLTTLVLLISIFVIKLVTAAYKRKLNDVTKLDPTWGPKCELFQRSRAMFSAQAMTKEYLYRQYHLQAGVLMRQRASNCRNGVES